MTTTYVCWPCELYLLACQYVCLSINWFRAFLFSLLFSSRPQSFTRYLFVMLANKRATDQAYNLSLIMKRERERQRERARQIKDILKRIKFGKLRRKPKSCIMQLKCEADWWSFSHHIISFNQWPWSEG